MSTWTTNDGRVIPVTELGDQHLVNILKKMELNRAGIDTPTPRFGPKIMQQYGELVIEGIRRGLFEWNANRKYLTPIMESIRSKNPTITISSMRGAFRV
jgi:hypothetical protein